MESCLSKIAASTKVFTVVTGYWLQTKIRRFWPSRKKFRIGQSPGGDGNRILVERKMEGIQVRDKSGAEQLV